MKVQFKFNKRTREVLKKFRRSTPMTRAELLRAAKKLLKEHGQ